MAAIQALLQLGMGNIPSHDDFPGQGQRGGHRVPGQDFADCIHGLVQVDFNRFLPGYIYLRQVLGRIGLAFGQAGMGLAPEDVAAAVGIDVDNLAGATWMRQRRFLMKLPKRGEGIPLGPFVPAGFGEDIFAAVAVDVAKGVAVAIVSSSSKRSVHGAPRATSMVYRFPGMSSSSPLVSLKSTRR